MLVGNALDAVGAQLAGLKSADSMSPPHAPSAPLAPLTARSSIKIYGIFYAEGLYTMLQRAHQHLLFNNAPSERA